MMDMYALNEYQREAICDESNACLVNANVGSGKTTVLISKIAYLHKEKGVPFEAMAVLTFTNKAADEIRERMKEIKICQNEDEMQWFGTFHGVALRMLQTVLPVEELGFRKDFLVCLPEEEIELAEQLILEYGLKIKYKNRLKKRLEQKQTGGSGKDYGDDFDRLWRLLGEEKKRQNKMTYQDLIVHAIRLLKEYQGILPFQWLIIDEVQDCDKEQLAFLKQLKSDDTRLFAVGDSNQVIYSWRGSAFQIFYHLREQYHARELALPVNYRSTGTILAAARRFLENGSRLEGVREQGKRIVVKNHYDSFQEADYLAGKIKELHMQGIPYREMAVFYRLQTQSKLPEQMLKREGIPCGVSKRRTLQEIPVLNWFIHVLRFAVNHEDTASGVQALCDRQFGEGFTLKQALASVKELMTAKGADCKSSLLKNMWNFKEDAQTTKEIPAALGLWQYIIPTSASYEENAAWIERVLMVIAASGSIRGFLNDAALYGMELDQEESDEESECVKLMTLHASKGLEFSHVFIVGVNYGLIPLAGRSFAEEDEERRLFFVGMTRAKEYLELSYYTSPDGYRVLPGKSSYLKMIPGELLEEEKAEREEVFSAEEHLQQMKRLVQKEKLAQKESVQREKDEKPLKEQKSGVVRVRHAKYGVGTVLKEDETMVTVCFDDYGEKELMKMFTTFEVFS